MIEVKKYTELVEAVLPQIDELFPWDLEERLQQDTNLLLLDIREPDEFRAMHIAGSLNVPRGILEGACDWGYDDTVPELAAARDREVIVICRSGNRSALAAHTMQQLGYTRVRSLKTGLRGWNDNEQPLVDATGATVDIDEAEEFFRNKPTPEQLGP